MQKLGDYHFFTLSFIFHFPLRFNFPDICLSLLSVGQYCTFPYPISCISDPFPITLFFNSPAIFFFISGQVDRQSPYTNWRWQTESLSLLLYVCIVYWPFFLYFFHFVKLFAQRGFVHSLYFSLCSVHFHTTGEIIISKKSSDRFHFVNLSSSLCQWPYSVTSRRSRFDENYKFLPKIRTKSKRIRNCILDLRDTLDGYRQLICNVIP